MRSIKFSSYYERVGLTLKTKGAKVKERDRGDMGSPRRTLRRGGGLKE